MRSFLRQKEVNWTLRQAYNALSEAVSDNETSVDFNSDPDVYVKAEVTSDDPDLQASLDACNNFTKASITYTFGDETVTLDGSTIKDWLNFDEKGAADQRRCIVPAAYCRLCGTACSSS